MLNQEIALAISGVCFGLVIGFLGGYAVRAYISYLRRHSNYRAWASGATDARVVAEPRSIISAASLPCRLAALATRVCRSVVPTPAPLPRHGLNHHHRTGG
jgi:hypothetical protein